MSKTAPISIDSFDPEVLAAAREVAKRAGVPLESWIESVTAPTQSTPAGRREPPAAGPDRRQEIAEAAPAAALPAQDEPRPQEAPGPARHPSSHPAAHPAPRKPAAAEAAPLDASLDAMMKRLDALDRSLDEQREASRSAAARMIGEIETRLAATQPPGPIAEEEAVTGRLAEIERRMGEIAGQLSTPRPLGRRGKPLASEMRDAVAEVRRRQRELEEGAEGGPAAIPQAPRAVEAAGLPSPAIVELQAETTRLRDSLGSLATGRDVGALEQAMRALVTDIQRARAPGDLAAIAAPIELMRVQVERLADDVAANVHARVAGEVERLALKVDGALTGAAPTFADQNALDGVFRELDEIRRLIGALAGPERIQSLAQGVQAISAQIAQLQRGNDAEVAALKPLLEEIRSGLKNPDESRALLGRFEALADRMDRAAESPAGNPVGELIGRLETLGESLRQQPAPPKDFASIRGMLETLAEKVDRVSTDGRGLDALEQHVVALAHRLDAPKAADPALGRLERTMGELVAQVSALKEVSALNDGVPGGRGPDLEAAVERATRAAVKDAMAGGAGEGAGDGALGLLRADLAELRASQRAADQRLHATMEGVQALLSRLSDQLDRAPSATLTSAHALAAAAPARAGATLDLPLPEAPAAEPFSRERHAHERPAAPKAAKAAAPNAAASATAAQAGQTVRPRPAIRPEDALDDVTRGGDELLEPGTGRPAPGRPAAPDAAVPAGNDIKTSFIAAARRAAQAAQAEAAAEQPLASRLRERMGGGVRATASGAGAAAKSADLPAAEGAASRVRGAVEKRRRTLLLGLAAVVLALGAYQAFVANGGPPPEEAAAPSGNAVAAAPEAARPAETRAVENRPAERGATESAAAPSASPSQPSSRTAATPPDPTTTQSLAEPGARADEAGRKAGPSAAPSTGSHPLPQVASMAGLAPDLAGVPPALAKLKQSALDGDGAAIWELAGREAEGRGVPRDLALAAKLYERLASAGYAPAQFKLGNAFEKGSGVTRDIAQAKSWYGRAADMGNTRAMHNLAVLHAENPAANGRPDFATAATAFRRAAEHGVRDSQYNLAVLYARGLGVGQDLVQSYLWFSTAAAQGDDEAGRKRDEVAGKLAPADLARGREMVAAFKPKAVDASANEAPALKAPAAPPTSLIGAPSPNLPNPNSFQKRAGV
ncbi:localization factor PodJL [Methylorubrum rhodinum]|uniref:Localization factor PodJL n=1 Tax=Methylorubrum rhodinum TaxID=29428 RepID=A0A840ZQG5_9HYPH|nr:tetratricopeptide repeat protein [Methylorubrum rhodinum]MBB5760379.1 localization factor PodJL [Methylorubrum rhodinum]